MKLKSQKASDSFSTFLSKSGNESLQEEYNKAKKSWFKVKLKSDKFFGLMRPDGKTFKNKDSAEKWLKFYDELKLEGFQHFKGKPTSPDGQTIEGLKAKADKRILKTIFN